MELVQSVIKVLDLIKFDRQGSFDGPDLYIVEKVDLASESLLREAFNETFKCPDLLKFDELGCVDLGEGEDLACTFRPVVILRNVCRVALHSLRHQVHLLVSQFNLFHDLFVAQKLRFLGVSGGSIPN